MQMRSCPKDRFMKLIVLLFKPLVSLTSYCFSLLWFRTMCCREDSSRILQNWRNLFDAQPKGVGNWLRVFLMLKPRCYCLRLLTNSWWRRV